MQIILYITIGLLLIFLGGKDPLFLWIQLRREGKSLTESMNSILPMFILPWPRTVNKRLLWLLAGSYLVIMGIYELRDFS